MSVNVPRSIGKDFENQIEFGGKTPVMIAVGQHLFPFRTEKLRLPAPKILNRKFGKIGRRWGFAFSKTPGRKP